MKPVTLGIVGARRGSSFARTALDGLDGRVRLTSVCDIDAGVLAQWRREHPELAYYQSYEQFLAQANVDAVVLSTPLQLHAPQALQALAAGKHVLSEVIAATTLDECWALIAAVQRSGLKYMFAENSCYRRENMLVLNMVEQGLFGEIICAEGGYIHDCTHLMYFPIGDYGQDRAGEPTWRGRILQQYNGSWYPTHSLGPVAQWLGINRHDRLVTTTTWMSHGPVMPEYVRQRFGPEHPDAHPEAFVAGCRAMTLIKCASGALITIIVDTTSPRPHNMVHYVLQGTGGSYLSRRFTGDDDVLWLRERVAPGLAPPKPHRIVQGRGQSDAESYRPLDEFAAEFDHPLWQEHEARAARTGHGGGDYFVLSEFIESIRNDTPPPIDVVDGVTWSSIFPLSMESVRQGGVPVPVPDFREPRP